jgi:predicted amidophosphoribosyltransferase
MYAGVVRRMLVAHKERGQLTLARPLGLLLAVAVVAGRNERTHLGREARAMPEVLVPVPSRRWTTRRRGHDPVARMARSAAPGLGGSVTVVTLLGHSRRVADQSGLDLQQRRANLGGALQVTRQAAAQPALLAGRDVVLVDDICSSGATLAAAARALQGVGVSPSQIRAAVVATPVLRQNGGSSTARSSVVR